MKCIPDNLHIFLKLIFGGCDERLSINLAACNSLIASEDKYYLTGYAGFLKNTTKSKNFNDPDDRAMMWLCAEWENSAKCGYLLALVAVWGRYNAFAEEQQFLSR